MDRIATRNESGRVGQASITDCKSADFRFCWSNWWSAISEMPDFPVVFDDSVYPTWVLGRYMIISRAGTLLQAWETRSARETRWFITHLP
jgi:hypothetical protein